MANVFKEGKMLSNVVDSYLTNAKAEVEMPDGGLVVLGALAADTTYDASGVEFDTYVATAPAAATDEVCVIDYAGISAGEIAGNNYKMGVKLFNLTVPVGEITRIRRLGLHDKFWLGGDNFSGEVAVGKYAIPEASKFTHKIVDSLSGHTGYAIKVIYKEGFTAGMKTQGYLYLCEVVQL